MTETPAPAGPEPTEITRLSDAFVTAFCQASPMTAIFVGRSEPGDGRLDDLSPDGLAEQARVARDSLTALRAAESAGASDDIARDVITDALQVNLDRDEAGLTLADLNVIASPVQSVRMVFDLMPTATDEDWATFAQRLRSVPQTLAGYRQSLLTAADRGLVSAVRQVDKCAEQCATYAGTADEPGYFRGRAAAAGKDGALGDELAAAAAQADQAYGELGAFLTGTLRARAPEKDAVGNARYGLESLLFLGGAVDLDEAYDWGWQEFLSLESELQQVAGRIVPGGDGKAAAAALDEDPRYQIAGVEAFQQWMQQLSDHALAELGRTHFEIAEPLTHLECLIAPPGGGVGAYYTAPSDDFSRPGRMWFSLEPGREVFSTWRETTTVYHEGTPGHHLQLATQAYQRAHLNDFQRLMAGCSGHAEGWALYAERLMRELGYLEDDGNLLGMLDGQLFRAARVVVDIGMHRELVIPAGTGFHEGERWTPELGLEFLLTRTLTDPAHCRDEIDRYLGWPGQAPAYKLGERVWLSGRRAAEHRHGDAFDVKAFHTAALNMGGMGLPALERQLAKL